MVDELRKWCLKNAGRKIRYRSSIGSEHMKVGRIVGYFPGNPDKEKIIVDGGITNALRPEAMEWMVDGLNVKAPHYSWIVKERFFEFVDPEPVLSATGKKAISDFPHECPRCHGPAYVGFLTTVDCKKKCHR